MHNAFLVGPKIYLRPLEKADAPTLVPWFNDADIARTLKWHRPLNLAAEEQFLANLYQGEGDVILGIAERATDQLVGSTGLKQIDLKNRHAGFGIVLEKGSWNKGYGTEATTLIVGYAFATLNLNRVWLHVYEDNPRAVRVYEKVGFKKEGVLRQENFRHGRYWDTFTMAVLREEWSAVQAAQ
jgi:RimJ/RimL family protein N-acetyltransferase